MVLFAFPGVDSPKSCALAGVATPITMRTAISRLVSSFFNGGSSFIFEPQRNGLRPLHIFKTIKQIQHLIFGRPGEEGFLFLFPITTITFDNDSITLRIHAASSSSVTTSLIEVLRPPNVNGSSTALRHHSRSSAVIAPAFWSLSRVSLMNELNEIRFLAVTASFA